MSRTSRWVALTLLLVLVAPSAAVVAQDPDPGPVPIGFTVRGVEGVTAELRLSVVGDVAGADGPDVRVQRQWIPLTADGTYSTAIVPCGPPDGCATWPDGRYPLDAVYSARVVGAAGVCHAAPAEHTDLAVLTHLVVECGSVPITFTAQGVDGLDVELSLVVRDRHAQVQLQDVAITADGTSSTADVACDGVCRLWPDGRFPLDATYHATVWDDGANRCRVSPVPEPFLPVLTPLHVDCRTTPISYSVRGLGDAPVEVELLIRDEEGRVHLQYLLLAADGTSSTADRPCAGPCRYWPDGRYPVDATYHAMVSDPGCATSQGEDFLSPVGEPLEIHCGDTVGLLVDGLVGADLVVRLLGEPDTDQDGRPDGELTVIEELPIQADGSHAFETSLLPDARWQVVIARQPGPPSQVCAVEDGSGVMGDGAALARLSCPRLQRHWRFDDTVTRRTADDPDDSAAGPLAQGSDPDGVLSERYWFGTGQGVALGEASGRADRPLYERYLDAPSPDGRADALGAVHSSRTGTTYWVLVESPAAGTTLRPGHHAELETWWGLRKVANQASFRLVLSAAELIGFDSQDQKWRDWDLRRLEAMVDLRVRAYRATTDPEPDDDLVPEQDAIAFFDAHGRMTLVGRPGPGMDCELPCPAARTIWTLEPMVEADAVSSLWATDADGEPLADAFRLDPAAALTSDPRQAAVATLDGSIVIEIPLGDLPEGEGFVVRSEAWVRAHNSWAAEGGAAAYLRDPAGPVETGDVEDPDAGMAAELTGVAMVEPSSIAGMPSTLELRAVEPAPPASCDPAVSPSSELAFDAPAYTVAEGGDRSSPVRITRTGDLGGPVDARIRVIPGSALAGLDVATEDLVVRFGPGDRTTRTLELPILDDPDAETDKTFRLALVEPRGCATLGATSMAEVTILDDEPATGVVAFERETLEVSEDVGEVALPVTRTGGTAGVIDIAVTSDDPGARPLQVRFEDGDGAPVEVRVPVTDDDRAEADRVIRYTLTGPLDRVGAPATLTLTIRDDDTGSPSPSGGTPGDAWVAWGPELVIDASHGRAGALDVAIDEAGSALAVWVAEAPGRTDLWSSRYGPHAGWDPPRLVETNDMDAYADAPRVAFDGTGTALAVWTQTDADTGAASAWASRLPAGAEWEEPVLLETAADAVVGPVALAVHPGGDAVAAWAQVDGQRSAILVNRFVVGTGWLGAERISDEQPLHHAPAVAIGPDGRVLVAWQASAQGTVWDIRTRWYAPATGWDDASVVSGGDGSRASTPRVALDAAGHGTVAWLSDPGGGDEVVAAQHVDGQGWGVPRVVASADGAGDLCLAVGPDGTAVVAWVSSVAADGPVTRTVQVSRSGPATSWSEPVAVSDTDAAGPSVVLGPDGRALIAWQAIDVQAPLAEAFSVRASRALTDGGWEPAELVSTPSGQLATGSPRIAAGSLGTVVAVWATGSEVHARVLE